jgi:hypothetical protein
VCVQIGRIWRAALAHLLNAIPVAWLIFGSNFDQLFSRIDDFTLTQTFLISFSIKTMKLNLHQPIPTAHIHNAVFGSLSDCRSLFWYITAKVGGRQGFKIQCIRGE